jgi:hypothetical protein
LLTPSPYRHSTEIADRVGRGGGFINEVLGLFCGGRQFRLDQGKVHAHAIFVAGIQLDGSTYRPA